MSDVLRSFLGKIHHQDCVQGLASVPAGTVDLVFADPPFNIGYEYDEYDDRLEETRYLEWSAQWMAGVHRILKDNGTFWLAIGDEYAAELKIEAKKLGFHVRNWVVWYYTFGVHCRSKFTRSHAHLFYFVKTADQFTFNFPEVAVPSARQLVYNDKRGNPKGRSPDDTWILRPQDCTDGFQCDEDTWYFPRVAGTFKERAGFHGCQMPEQLLGRILRACTNEGEVVVDPFSGSSTTLTVAKKLGRQFIGFELSADYVKRGTDRLARVFVGDPLEGAEEPRGSAPSTYAHLKDCVLQEPSAIEIELNAEAAGLIEAFGTAHRGFSVDRLVADPILNEDFQLHCDRLSIPGAPSERNRCLFRLRKSGRLKRAGVQTTKATEIDWQQIDPIVHASEIAWKRMAILYSTSLDEIFCDPRMAREFDQVAQRIAPGRVPLEYRWGALRIRKEVGMRRRNLHKASPHVMKLLDTDRAPLDDLPWDQIPSDAGVYAITSRNPNWRYVYIGETQNLRRRLEGLLSEAGRAPWLEFSESQLQIQFQATPVTVRLTNQLVLLQHVKGTLLNSPDMCVEIPPAQRGEEPGEDEPFILRRTARHRKKARHRAGASGK